MGIKVLNPSHVTFRDYYAPGTIFRLKYNVAPCPPISLLLVKVSRTGNNTKHLLVATDTCTAWDSLPLVSDGVGVSHAELVGYLEANKPNDADEVVLSVMHYVSPEAYHNILRERVTNYMAASGDMI